jgi:hypothetical protein
LAYWAELERSFNQRTDQRPIADPFFAKAYCFCVTINKVMKGLMAVAAYIAAVFFLFWLCDVAPLIGYPLAVLFVLWMFFNFRRRREVLDTEPPPDHFHHHH